MTEERHEQKLARWVKDGKRGPEPLPAATVIPIRDGGQGLEALMLRRNSKIAFGGMWVFPGGRVDPDDRDPTRPDDELATARRAAGESARRSSSTRASPEGV